MRRLLPPLLVAAVGLGLLVAVGLGGPSRRATPTVKQLLADAERRACAITNATPDYLVFLCPAGIFAAYKNGRVEVLSETVTR